MRLAGVIALLAVVTFPLLSYVLPGANAKYVANAKADASARVAKWEVKVEGVNVPVEPTSIPAIPTDGSIPGHELVLFFQGLEKDTDPTKGKPVEGDAKFIVTFKNNAVWH